ncbi:MAG: ABC transporter ATP-binding protein [Desulfobacteraceae bacterium]|nr:ABC transporter ATP-binding protein [Desulfobacteraceae bacterium]
MKIIEIEGVSHIFGDGSCGLKKITLSIEKGSFVVIAGANGSGKTTLLRHLNGLLPASEGFVCVKGELIEKNIKLVRQKVGLVFQDADSQIVGETVYDDVAFGPENLCWSHKEIQNAVEQALLMLDLQNYRNQSPHLLSGGEKRRLAIAGVLAMKPEVIILDEPFANLDYGGVRQVLKSIIDLHEKGHTIIVSSHDLEKVAAHASRLVVMHKGGIVKDGAPSDVIHCVEQYGIRLPCSVKLNGALDSWLN